MKLSDCLKKPENDFITIGTIPCVAVDFLTKKKRKSEMTLIACKNGFKFIVHFSGMGLGAACMVKGTNRFGYYYKPEDIDVKEKDLRNLINTHYWDLKTV